MTPKIMLIFGCFIALSFQIIRKESLHLSARNADDYGLIRAFYFDDGGEFSATVTDHAYGNPFALALYKGSPDETVCNPDSKDEHLVFYKEIGKDDKTVAMNYVAQRGDHRLYVISCFSGAIKFDIEYTFVNPGGEHLSLNMIPLKYTSLVFGILWFIVLGQWFVNWLMHKKSKAMLHLAISTYPLCATVTFAIGTIYYFSESSNGKSTTLLYFSVVFNSLKEALFLFLLLLIVQGYGISSRDFLRKHTFAISVLGLLYFTAKFFSYLLGGFYSFLSTVILLIAFFFIFKYTQENILFLSSTGKDEENSASKLELFKRFRIVLFSYLVGLIIISFILFFTEFTIVQWLPIFLEDLLSCGIVLFTLFFFRLRGSNKYYLLDELEMMEPASTQTSLETEPKAQTEDINSIDN